MTLDVVFDNEFGRCVVDLTEYGPCLHLLVKTWSPSCFRYLNDELVKLETKYPVLYAVSPKGYDTKWLKFIVMFGFEFLDRYEDSCVVVRNKTFKEE